MNSVSTTSLFLNSNETPLLDTFSEIYPFQKKTLQIRTSLVEAKDTTSVFDTSSSSFFKTEEELRPTSTPMIMRIDHKSVGSVLPPRPQRRAEQEAGQVLQSWEGCVLEVGQTEILARLLDRTNKDVEATEELRLPIEDIDVADRDLVREGAIFYLTVIRKILRNRRQRTVSSIVFRRLPLWHKSTLDKAGDEADALSTYFEMSND